MASMVKQKELTAKDANERAAKDASSAKLAGGLFVSLVDRHLAGMIRKCWEENCGGRSVLVIILHDNSIKAIRGETGLSAHGEAAEM